MQIRIRAAGHLHGCGISWDGCISSAVGESIQYGRRGTHRVFQRGGNQRGSRHSSGFSSNDWYESHACQRGASQRGTWIYLASAIPARLARWDLAAVRQFLNLVATLTAANFTLTI